MTQGAADDEVVEEFTTTPKVRNVKRFTIDGELVSAREPKGALMVQFGRILSSGSELEQVAVLDMFIDKVFDEESRAYLRRRLEDDEDDFDLDELEKIMQRLQEVWAVTRPTGPSSGSRGRQQRTSKRSTARAR